MSKIANRVVSTLLSNALLFLGAAAIIVFDIAEIFDQNIDWNGLRQLASLLLVLGAVVKILILEQRVASLSEKVQNRS